MPHRDTARLSCRHEINHIYQIDDARKMNVKPTNAAPIISVNSKTKVINSISS